MHAEIWSLCLYIVLLLNKGNGELWKAETAAWWVRSVSEQRCTCWLNSQWGRNRKYNFLIAQDKANNSNSCTLHLGCEPHLSNALTLPSKTQWEKKVSSCKDWREPFLARRTTDRSVQMVIDSGFTGRVSRKLRSHSYQTPNMSLLCCSQADGHKCKQSKPSVTTHLRSEVTRRRARHKRCWCILSKMGLHAGM